MAESDSQTGRVDAELHPAQGPHGLERLGLLALLLGVLLVRGGVLWLRPEGLAAHDPDGYRALSANLLQFQTLGGGNRPTAYRPPLYPWLLTPAISLGRYAGLGIALLHVALGASTVLAVVWMGQRWHLGRFTWLAAVLVACDPILVKWSSEIMTETLATFLVTLSMAWLIRAKERETSTSAALAGVCLGLCALCRPTFLPWLGMCALAMVAGNEARLAWRQAAAMALAGCLVLLPWIIRNQIQFGSPVATTTHGGYTLLLGNNPSFYRYLRLPNAPATWSSRALDMRIRAARTGDEVVDDRHEYALAVYHARHDPRGYLQACLYRLSRLWGLRPRQVSSGESRLDYLFRQATSWFYVGETMLVLLGLFALARIQLLAAPRVLATSPNISQGHSFWRLLAVATRHPALWGFLLAAVLCSVHTIYWTDMRMRAPLIPWLALVSAQGAAWAWKRLSRQANVGRDAPRA